MKEYEKRTWGPEDAERLVRRFGGWHGPWVADRDRVQS